MSSANSAPDNVADQAVDKKYRVLAVIPARGGSKGVPRKNIRPLAGKPLLAYTIETAKRSGVFTDIVVSTDDAEIQRVAIEHGAQAPFLRPPELATDGALAIPTLQHAVREMETRTGERYDVIAMLQPTTPLRSPEDLSTPIRDLLQRAAADGVISVVDVDNWHPIKMKKFADDWLTDYEPWPVENPPRQSLPKAFMVNGSLYASRRMTLMEKNSFKGLHCLGYVMPFERSVNIDTEADFTVAEHFLKKSAGAAKPRRPADDNASLRSVYERAYSTGADQFFTFPSADVTLEILAELSDWQGLRVLELGCGQGDTAASLAQAGARVVAIDYASAAIEEARRRHANSDVRFEVGSWEEVARQFPPASYDVVVLQDILEHLDEPRETLRTLSAMLAPTGQLIVTCPSFVNLRGYVWMTLQLLLDVPMSLTDRHFIAPWQMQEWAAELGLACRWRTFRYPLAHGALLRQDMQKRLTNALRDAKLDNRNVDRLLTWLEKAAHYQPDADYNGAKALYRLSRLET